MPLNLQAMCRKLLQIIGYLNDNIRLRLDVSTGLFDRFYIEQMLLIVENLNEDGSINFTFYKR
jgi:hypothetical protein